MPDFLPRALAPLLRDALSDTPVACVIGSRQSGKTTLVQRLDPDRRYLTLDESNYRRAAREDPEGFVASLPTFVTLDEVQKAPALLPAIKVSVDRDRRPGRFLLTGSANLNQVPAGSESLAGRMEIQTLHPLTEAEKERRRGGFLEAFLEGALGPGLEGESGNWATDVPERLVAGGYPEVRRRPAHRARQWHRNYVRQILARDVRDVARIRDWIGVERLLELLAYRPGATLNVSRLANGLRLRRETVRRYLAVLERLFLIRRLPAWSPSGAKRVIKAPKVHFVDSGLLCTLAGRTAADWLDDRSAMGGVLETFAVQQLIAEGSWTDPDLRFWHFRSRDGAEVDLVITRRRQTWGVEIKASRTVEPRDARGLLRLAAATGDAFEGGVVLYTGEGRFRLGHPRIHSAGIRELWER